MGTHGKTPKVSDDDAPFGAVRQIKPQGRPEVVVYVENAGDFTIPLSVIKPVHSQKVIVDCDKLEHRLRKRSGMPTTTMVRPWPTSPTWTRELPAP
jgi:hypothetical protein